MLAAFARNVAYVFEVFATLFQMMRRLKSNMGKAHFPKDHLPEARSSS